MAVKLRGPGHPEQRSTATAQWASEDEIHSYAQDNLAAPHKNPLYFRRGSILLGETLDDEPALVGWDDDRHLVTVAGSRAGKGRSAIVPNLKCYAGSVLCIDPKGENAQLTAVHRARKADRGGLGQQVYVLDPFGVTTLPSELGATFNPLDQIDPNARDFIEQAAALADSIVVSADAKDAHWDESARALLEALIIHVKTADMRGRQVSLITVRELLSRGDMRAAITHQREQDALQPEPSTGSEIEFPVGIDVPGFSTFQTEAAPPELVDPMDALLNEMLANEAGDGVVSTQARKILWMANEERSSIFSVLERNTKFLDGQAMARVLQRSSRTIDFASLKTSRRGVTVYLCLPTRYMASHARWLRLVLGVLMGTVERVPADPNTGKPKSGVPILAILDEFPVLGNLKIIETAIGYMAGFGLKLWIILQDISQLKRDYPNSWETFLGNAGVKQFFGNTDWSTLEFISKNLGETDIHRHLFDTSKSSSHGESIASQAERRQLAKTANATTTEEDVKGVQTQKSVSSSERIEVVKSALMTPDEVAIYFSRENQNQLVQCAGWRPMILGRLNQDELSGRLLDIIINRSTN